MYTMFRSYLCERIFFMEIENQLSDYGKVSCGVPQGCILGHLLFLVYVNDMPPSVKSNLFFYADDSYLSIVESALFASKRKIKSARKLNVKYKNKTTFASYISWLCFG